jgi:hypothetical protein
MMKSIYVILSLVAMLTGAQGRAAGPPVTDHFITSLNGVLHTCVGRGERNRVHVSTARAMKQTLIDLGYNWRTGVKDEECSEGDVCVDLSTEGTRRGLRGAYTQGALNQDASDKLCEHLRNEVWPGFPGKPYCAADSFFSESFCFFYDAE